MCARGRKLQAERPSTFSATISSTGRVDESATPRRQSLIAHIYGTASPHRVRRIGTRDFTPSKKTDFALFNLGNAARKTDPKADPARRLRFHKLHLLRAVETLEWL